MPTPVVRLHSSSLPPVGEAALSVGAGRARALSGPGSAGVTSGAPLHELLEFSTVDHTVVVLVTIGEGLVRSGRVWRLDGGVGRCREHEEGGHGCQWEQSGDHVWFS